ncbi:MAG TPA: hypothetical protein PKM65_04635 [Spirochaetota bacterium]|nr:hypothetical protein [Spirochaetota bacterium]HNT10634.1 hypothetical protein [Spirochaetota bacterium]
MQITCSTCDSQYTLTDAQVSGLRHSIFQCRSCGKYIKIAFCQHCNCLYSITFTTASSPQYRLTCRRCGKQFVVNFPTVAPVAVDATTQRAQAPATRPKKNDGTIAQKIGRLVTVVSIFRKKPADPSEKTAKRRVDTPVSRNTEPVFSVDTFRDFTLREIFTVCASSFTLPKIGAGVIGTVLLALLLIVYARIDTLVVMHVVPKTHASIRGVLQLVPILIVFVAYVTIAAVISRITIKDLFRQNYADAGSLPRFIIRALPSICITNVLVLFSAGALFIVFGHIPLIGPFFYSLIFLPVYLLSLGIIIVAIIGFWFYPPLVAYRKSGIAENAINLFHFIRRHNFNLLFFIPILSFTGLLVVGVLYYVHVGAFSLTAFLTESIIPHEGAAVFSAIPSDLLRVFDISITGRGQGLLRSFHSNAGAVHQIAGLFVGIGLFSLSLVLYAMFMSITATLSTHVFIMLERGRDFEDWKKAVVLITLVLLLAGCYLVKRLLS